MQFKDQRQSYEKSSLDESQVLANPVAQFQVWLQAAHEAKLGEAYAMSLATSGADGRPHVRTMLMREITDTGLSFFSNYQSLKGLNLSQNPQAEVLFFWPNLEQQVRIGGTIVPLSESESTAYFHMRPTDSQIGAWVSNPQSGIIQNRATLDERFEILKAQFANSEQIPKPDYWGGYLLVPDMFEFWQGRANRLHDRVRYSRTSTDGWRIERLMP